ncbi:MAG TPA: delta-aminolevulinic acid dehydratase, partial [Blastocatellia bacterium]
MPCDTGTTRLCEQAIEKLLRYCRGEHWIGYDPYDGLNSPLAKALSFNSKFLRTAAIQLVKRSPINFRPLIGIKKALNPKGAALAARAITLLAHKREHKLPADIAPSAQGAADDLQKDFETLISALISSRSEGYDDFCWGYNFDWQSRAFFAPRGTPNVVCTVFAAHAMLDWYDATTSQSSLDCAQSSCRFLLDALNRSRDENGFCFSYTPLDRSRVHNVNMLAAELLARVHKINGSEEFREAAESAAMWTLNRQRDGGSWFYGEADSQRWIDGFHTGYVLVSLRHLIDHLDRRDWTVHLERGFEFYKNNFFLEDATPKYYHDRAYPIDIHSSAQAVITFIESG